VYAKKCLTTPSSAAVLIWHDCVCWWIENWL